MYIKIFRGLLDSGRFGISNFAKPKSGKFSNFWKVFLAIFGVVLVAVLVWSFTQKSKKDENSVHIDDYQVKIRTIFQNYTKSSLFLVREN